MDMGLPTKEPERLHTISVTVDAEQRPRPTSHVTQHAISTVTAEIVIIIRPTTPLRRHCTHPKQAGNT